MHSQRLGRTLLLATTCLALVAVACKKQPAKGPVEAKQPALFLPAAQSQDQLMVTVVLPSMDGTLAKVADIAKELQLPFGEDQLRTLMQGPLGLPDEVWPHLDASAPIALAMMAGKENVSIAAVAAKAKSATSAQALVAALGEKLGEQDGALHIKRADESEAWVFISGDQIVASDSLLSLKVAGAHALANQQHKSEDILATFYPEALAKSQGTTVQAAIDDARTKFLETLNNPIQPVPSAISPESSGKIMTAFLDPYLRDLTTTRAVDVALMVTKADGLRIRGRLHPIVNSTMAKLLSNVVPYHVDPVLLEGPLPAGLLALNYGPEVLKRYGESLAALAQTDVPGMKAFAEGVQGILPAFAGGASGRFTFNPSIAYSLVVELAEGAEPTALMAHFDTAFGPEGLALLYKSAIDAEVKGKSRKPKQPALVWKRKGLTGHLEVPLYSAGATDKASQQLKQMFGDKLVYTVKIVGNKLLMVVHPKPEAEIARLSGPPSGAAHPGLEQALSEVAGSEGFFYLDLFSLVRPIIEAGAKTDPGLAQASMMMKMLPGVEKMTVPMLFSYQGGESFLVQWAVPLRAFENVSTALRPMLGAPNQ